MASQLLFDTRLVREGRLRLGEGHFCRHEIKSWKNFWKTFWKYKCYLLWETLRSLEEAHFLFSQFKCPLNLVVCGHQAACQLINTGWGKSRFTDVSTGNTEFILVLSFMNYCILVHTNNVNLLLPHSLFLKRTREGPCIQHSHSNEKLGFE